ncbi:hypothetical protein ACHAW6_005017 [Cyclotella cf. meneghiniana]
MELTKDEWLDNIYIQYGQRPANLLNQCNGCGAGLTLEHRLNYKRGGLVGIHHDDAHLCSISLTNLQVVIKPTILYGNGSQAGANNATPSTPPTTNTTSILGDEARGDVLAHGFWNHGRGTVFDVCIYITDSHSYGNTTLSKIPECHAKKKRDKYEAPGLEHCQDFTPLVYSIDGMASKDAQMDEQRLTWLLAKKNEASPTPTWSTLPSSALTPSSSMAAKPTHSDDTPPLRAL